MTSIAEFKGAFSNVARPTLFRVTGFGTSQDFEFLCKAAQVPEVAVGIIELPFQGRKIKIPGDRTFADWTGTIINDNQYRYRKFFEDWVETISDAGGVNAQSTEIEAIKRDGKIEQLDLDGSVIASWTLIGAWPSNVSSQDLAFDSNDTASEFTITLSYDYHTRDSSGNSIDISLTATL